MNTEAGLLRILIADDQEDMRVMLRQVIEAEDDMELVAAAADAAEAVRLTQELEPDVAVLDWMMPGGGGTAAREISQTCPDVRVIAFTAGDPMNASYDMLGAGASGMLAKGASNDEIIAGIRSVRRW